MQSVRALATLGVVTLHAGVPYASHPMPGLCWAVWDRTGDGVDVTFWSISLFIMPLFLVMSGYFAALTERRHGGRGLLRKRTRRLLRPLAFGLVVLIPASYSVWMLGWIGDGLTEPIKARSLKFAGGIDRDLYGTAHLWFLLYAFTYVAIAAALSSRWRVPQRAESIGAACLVLIGAVCVAVRPEVVWGFQHAWLPVPSKWIFCGTFFAGGWWLAIRDPELQRIRQVSVVSMAAALILAGFTVMLGRWHLGGGEGMGGRILLSLLSVISAWGVTLATLGAAERWVRRLSRPVAYVAAASLWIYLVHHPIVALVQVDLKFYLVNVPPFLKMVVASATATALSLLTYEAWGRRSGLGQWLSVASAPGIGVVERERAERDRFEQERLEQGRVEQSRVEQSRVEQERVEHVGEDRSIVRSDRWPHTRRGSDRDDAKRAA